MGTGKTEVSKVLQELGAEAVHADDVAHEVYLRDTEGWREVVEEFGEGVLGPDGEVDRGRLAAVVFEDEGALKRLEAIVHPRARSMTKARLRELEEQGREVVVVEVPLLLEAGWTSLVDEVWVTATSQEQVVDRIRSRNQLRKEAVMARVGRQMPQAERLEHADAVIDNNGSLPELQDRVRVLWQERVLKDKRHQSQR